MTHRFPRFATQFAATTIAQKATSDWTGFRGPESNPTSDHPGLVDRWSKTENIEWATAIPGRGWSSPIVVGNRVFVTAATTDGKSKAPQVGTDYSNAYVDELSKQGLSEAEIVKKLNERDFEMPDEVTLHYLLHCVDLRTGRRLWQRELHTGRPPGGRHRKNSFMSETPVSDGNRVYVYVANLGLWAFDLNGKPVWKTPLEANPIYLEFGTGGSPVLADDKIVILTDNQKRQYLAAFETSTGKPAWRTDRDLGPKQFRSGWTTPFVWKTPERTEIVTVGPEILASYDLSGKELWRLKGMSPAPIPMPFASGGLLIVDAGKGRPIYAIRPGARGDITLASGESSSPFVAWSQPRAGSYLPTPVAYSGGIYALSENGILSRYDAATGAPGYRERLTVGDHFTSSPWAANGKIFCLSEEGRTYVVPAGPDFKVLRVNPLDEMAQATPAMAGDRLLLRTETLLYSIKRTAGMPRPKASPGGRR